MRMESKRAQQWRRIAAYKRQAKQLAGACWESVDLAQAGPELQETFWKHVVEFEQAPLTTYDRELIERGHLLQPAASLSNAELSTELTELITILAEMHVYLCHTDHLSDRQLYGRLETEILHEPVKRMPPEPGNFYLVDLVGSGAEEEFQDYLRYYATEREREYWRTHFPQEPIPPRQPVPFDRDRGLPRPAAG